MQYKGRSLRHGGQDYANAEKLSQVLGKGAKIPDSTTMASKYLKPTPVFYARFSEYITALENSDYDDYLEKNLSTHPNQTAR
jgi:hypothetical protein